MVVYKNKVAIKYMLHSLDQMESRKNSQFFSACLLGIRCQTSCKGVLTKNICPVSGFCPLTFSKPTYPLLNGFFKKSSKENLSRQ